MAKPIDELWEKLSKSDSTSLLKQYLTPDVYAKLKDKKTSLGGTLAHCINSGKYTLPATYWYKKNSIHIWRQDQRQHFQVLYTYTTVNLLLIKQYPLHVAIGARQQ